ncbi:beta-ketoacyl reductase [Streptomyces albus]
MARALESGQLRGSGLRPLEPDRAVDALWSAVAEGTPTLLVADVDWDGYAARAAVFRPSPQLAELTAAAASPAASARLGTEELAGLTAEQRRARLLEVVREQIAVTLGHGARWRLEGDRPFQELGFDSLTAVELRNRLDAVTGLRLPSTLVFRPSDGGRAGHLPAGGAVRRDRGRARAAAGRPGPAGGGSCGHTAGRRRAGRGRGAAAGAAAHLLRRAVGRGRRRLGR